jgi:hypothetical protein
MTLTALSVTTGGPEISMVPLVQAMESNSSITRLQLYIACKHNNGAADEMVRILQSGLNTTLKHCNSLGSAFGSDGYHSILFYTKLNQLPRAELLRNDTLWMDTLFKHSQDGRIVQYLLSNNPSMLQC